MHRRLCSFCTPICCNLHGLEVYSCHTCICLRLSHPARCATQGVCAHVCRTGWRTRSQQLLWRCLLLSGSMPSGGHSAWLYLQVNSVPNPPCSMRMNGEHGRLELPGRMCMVSHPLRRCACSVHRHGAATNAAALQPEARAVARLQCRCLCRPVDHGATPLVSLSHVPPCQAALPLPRPRGDPSKLRHYPLPLKHLPMVNAFAEWQCTADLPGVVCYNGRRLHQHHHWPVVWHRAAHAEDPQVGGHSCHT